MIKFMKGLFVKNQVSDIVKELCKDIVDNHKDWQQNAHTFSKNSFQIWTSNGLLYIDTYPETKAYNLAEKRLIKKSIKRANILNALA